jgi:hypothetical protein
MGRLIGTAQGCEEQASLGEYSTNRIKPEGVGSIPELDATHSGLRTLSEMTQGSSFLAPLGWKTPIRLGLVYLIELPARHCKTNRFRYDSIG